MDPRNDIKYFKEPVAIIAAICKTGWGIFIGEALTGVKARFRRDGKQFYINWTSTWKPAEGTLGKAEYHDLDFQFRGHDLRLENIRFDNFFPAHIRVTSTNEVDFFYTAGFSKTSPYYYRLIVPLEKNLDFNFQLTRMPFVSDFGIMSSLGTRTTINGDVFQVCVFKDPKDNYYLSVESKVEHPFEIFSNKAHAIINGLGFMTGHLAGNAGWYFAYRTQEMKDPAYFYHNPMRDHIHGSYTPVNTNPSAWVHDRVEAKRLHDLKFLKPVSPEVFSNLCQQLFDSLAFSAAVLLLLESSVASLVFMPGGYAIVLESLADYMTPEEKEDLAPMKPALSRKVREKLSAVINEECKDITEEKRNILLGKIGQINQVTNRSRLRSPFDRLKIPLNERDLQLINTRNDFLHGRIPDLTEAGDDRSTERKNKDLYYAAMRFYTLLGRLILGWVGYDNYVLNHAKIQEYYTRILLDEDYYLKALPGETIADEPVKPV